jgi:hypothetical protein
MGHWHFHPPDGAAGSTDLALPRPDPRPLGWPDAPRSHAPLSHRGFGVLSLFRISRWTPRPLVDLPGVVPGPEPVLAFGETHVPPMRAGRHSRVGRFRTGIGPRRAPSRHHRSCRGLPLPHRAVGADLSALLSCRQPGPRHGLGRRFLLRSRHREEHASAALRGARGSVHGLGRLTAQLAGSEPGAAVRAHAARRAFLSSRLSRRRRHGGVACSFPARFFPLCARVSGGFVATTPRRGDSCSRRCCRSSRAPTLSLISTRRGRRRFWMAWQETEHRDRSRCSNRD